MFIDEKSRVIAHQTDRYLEGRCRRNATLAGTVLHNYSRRYRIRDSGA